MEHELALLISTLLEQLESSRSGHLPLPSRKLLWRSLSAGQSGQACSVRLAKLHAICVRHGLPIWCEKFADPKAIDAILDTARGAASGAVSHQQAQRVRDDFYVAVVEDEEYETGEYPAMFVGHAAANTITMAISDTLFDAGDKRDDHEMDAEAFFPDYLIASAVAGGLDEDGDTRLRRTFWKWYLTHAVPQAVAA
ncbi:Imm5 family immunity protein [Janthinobacterium sp. RB2R34]|uniref:Imm5 family immunity protein n=1 Tax=Janthinobacterium sp. RB2R34 TaxID=3424193 RepID=UPI003F22CC73